MLLAVLDRTRLKIKRREGGHSPLRDFLARLLARVIAYLNYFYVLEGRLLRQVCLHSTHSPTNRVGMLGGIRALG